MTSRSFAAVIKELDGDLARTICIFYLVLRGLDTVEDDMTLRDDEKQPLLRSFHEKLTTKGWNFDGSGEQEKDKQLLVEFDVVVDEVLLLQPEYRDVIVDICRKMETGMADFAHQAALSPTPLTLETVEDLDLYCHYVAGLVGEGLSRLFSASGKEAKWIAGQLTLSNSCGLLLQKTNILRDYSEDCDEKRYFWPREIWAPYGFTDITQIRDPAMREQGLWALSAMTLDALRHATDTLDYLTLLKNQSVFNFVAIPATMALATLSLCFMNEAVLTSNVKIRKAKAVELIMSSTNPRDVAYMFRDSARDLHAKLSPKDPNFVKISIACGKIEQWAEHHYPSFIDIQMDSSKQASLKLNETDARARLVKVATDRKEAEAREKVNTERPPQPPQEEGPTWQFFAFVLGGFTIVMGGSIAIVFFVAWIMGWLEF